MKRLARNSGSGTQLSIEDYGLINLALESAPNKTEQRDTLSEEVWIEKTSQSTDAEKIDGSSYW